MRRCRCRRRVAQPGMVGIFDVVRPSEGSLMGVEVHPVPAEGEPDLPTPLNGDGEPFLYCMIFNADTVMAFSDSATALVDLLIDGYLEIPEPDVVEQATQRTMFAVGAQVRTQAAIVARANLSLATPEERTMLGGSRDTPPELTVWECPIPLVLVDAFYEPYSNSPRPVGRPRTGGERDSNIIWLSFVDEVEFLYGLHRAGEIQLATHDGSRPVPVTG